MDTVSLALAGALAGVTHALTGPDHLAAVLPLAAEDPRRAVRTALVWALGHGAGTLTLAGVVALLRGRPFVDGVAAPAETVIGVALVATGAWGLFRARRRASEGLLANTARGRTRREGVALGFGTLHGVAGGTHVVTVLAALALPTTGAGAWLVGFVGGAGVAMAGVVRLAGLAGVRLPSSYLQVTQRVASSLAILVGAVWVVRALHG